MGVGAGCVAEFGTNFEGGGPGIGNSFPKFGGMTSVSSYAARWTAQSPSLQIAAAVAEPGTGFERSPRGNAKRRRNSFRVPLRGGFACGLGFWRDDLCVIREHRAAEQTAGRDRARPSRRLVIRGSGGMRYRLYSRAGRPVPFPEVSASLRKLRRRRGARWLWDGCVSEEGLHPMAWESRGHKLKSNKSKL